VTDTRPNPTFGSSWRRQRLSVDERVARGRDARRTTPRSAHASFTPASDRLDPVAVLEAQAATRVPELVPIRYGRMLVSPFTFYRGAAAIMAGDLAATPNAEITVQCCGDAHLSNFGLFGTPERRLIFDINDFDETLPGPWEWDVKRLITSFEIMGRDLGYTPDDRRDIAIAGAGAYRERMRESAAEGTLNVWYDHLEAGALLDEVAREARKGNLGRDTEKRTESDIAKARTRDSVRLLSKRAETVDGELRIVPDPPLIVPVAELVEPGSEWEQTDVLVKELLSSYRRTLGVEHHPLEEFRYVDAARKVVGVGSVGTRCYILLLIGRDEADPLFLQVKEANASVLEPYAGASEYTHHGHRVVAGQRLMQASTDVFLGWQRITGLEGVTRDYYIRQLHDWKGSLDTDMLPPRAARLYARICGATLARAHARWGDRVAIGAYLGKRDRFDAAIADFAASYADQNERDYASLVAAVKAGRVVAETGV